MILETERLILRQMTYEDQDALYAVLADSDIMQHYPYTFDADRVRNWIKRNIDRYEKDGFGLWAVVLKESGEMIGDCGITMQNIHGQWLPEIGENLGHVLLPENKKVMDILRAAFAAWYDNGHTNEADPNTCLLKIRLTDGVLFAEGKRYDIEFE